MRALLLVSLGGVLGANARYLVGLWAARRWGDYPYGTLFVNVTGSFLIGFVLGLVAARAGNSGEIRLLVVTGFLGSYTTFSAFSYEVLALAQRGAVPAALGYAAASVGLGVLAVVAGALVARAF